MSKKSKLVRYLATTCLVSLVAPQAAKAEIDEIVVTVQKREQSLQDVPVAVTAISSEALVENNIRSFQDLGAVAPGLVASNDVGYGSAPLSIRGIGGANGGNAFGDEPVAVYIDEVYQARPRFSTADLLDIEAVEVLRGPQGTFFGRNATGGALLVRTARPTFESEAFLTGAYSTLEETRVQGAVSGPIANDKLAGRVAVLYGVANGWGDNPTRNERVPNSDSFSSRASLLWDATESLEFTLIGDYSRRESWFAFLRVADLSNPAAIPVFDRRPDFQSDLDSGTFDHNDPQFSEIESKGITLLGEWDLGPVVVNSVTAYRDTTMHGSTDTDNSPLALTNNTAWFYDDQFSQELRLSSNEPGRLQWVIGAFYMQEENALDPFCFTAFCVTADHEGEAFAVFADATFDVTDQFSIAAGGRYSYEEKTFENSLLPSDSGDWNDFSPRLVLQYRPADDIFAYASFSKAFKSGGFNAFETVAGRQEYDPEKIDAYEVGLKTKMFDASLRTNVSVFHYKYDDLQVRTTPGGAGGAIIQNAAKATVEGIEVEAMWLPDDHWTLTGNLAYLDATFDEGSVSSVDPVVNALLPVPISDRDVSGNRLSRAPEWQGYVGAKYATDLGDAGELSFDVNYRFQSETFFFEAFQDRDGYKGEAWGSLGARVAFTSTDGKYELAVFGRNLLDERFVTQVTTLGNLPHAGVSDPIHGGIQFTVRR